MKKPLLLVILLISLTHFRSAAADFTYASVTAAELQMKQYDKDTNAHAVVLNEFGKGYITERADRLVLIYEYHVKVKLFDTHAFDSQGNVEIPLYKEDNNTFEEVNDITGTTTYLDENGIRHTVELDKSKIFTVNGNKYHDMVKFALPGLTKGCVVEYKYTVITPFFFNFKTWEFQSDIPKIHSEFNADIPAVYNYSIVLRGPLKLTKNISELQRDCFSQAGTKADCSNLTFIMENVPAFETEDYMTSPKNFLSAIYFELSDYTSLRTGAKVKVTQDWKDIDYTLKTSEYFGSQIKRKELMKDRIKTVIENTPDDLSKAKAIYAFIQKSIKWNGFYTKYSDDGIRKALDNHTGAIGDINLALIAALNAAELKPEAVLISTREHGLVNKLFPVESDFNYVIAKVTIGEKSYLLDATDPLLGFGMLPLKCINDQGRVISMTKPSYWMDITEPEKKIKTYALDLTLQPNGKLKGTYTAFLMGYESYEKRKEIKKFNTFEEYVENLDEKHPRIKILNSSISGLDSLDKPITEKYEIEIDAYDHLNHERLSLNPFIFGQITVNPFKLAERTYPVDMGMPSDVRYILSLHLPDDYTLESAPQNIGLSMPDAGGKLISSFSNDNGNCIFSQVVQFTKPVYSVAEYPYLKEMYNKYILSQKTEIVFKKK